jgi:hypothetical protein
MIDQASNELERDSFVATNIKNIPAQTPQNAIVWVLSLLKPNASKQQV